MRISSRVFLLFLLLCSIVAAQANPSIHYTITVENPVHHYFHIRIDLRNVQDDWVELQMPAWSPGRYVIHNFARNIRDFNAASTIRPIPFQKTDKQTWRVQNGKEKDFSITYRVYANTLSGEYSQLNDLHGFLDGASLYMYLVDHKHVPVTLTVNNLPRWRILSSAGELGENHFRFADYDLLIDNLVQVGTFFVRRFTLDGVDYRVSIVNNGEEKHIDQFISNLETLQRTVSRMMPPLDTLRYTFFFHFLPDSRNSAGMEHLNSCQITRKHDLTDSGTNMDWTYWITAHEAIHAWNIKRLRPQGLGPWDYTKEAYTELLWFGEGCTSYLADLTMYRSGLWSQEKFFNTITSNIQQYRSTPGIFERSAEQSSFDTWFWDTSTYGDTDWNNVFINYYLKGNLLGYCIDFQIRQLTQNRSTFEEFFKLLYEQYYSNAESESYYLQGRGYTTQDLFDALETITHSSWQEFYERNIARPGDVDFEHYFSIAGLSLKPSEKQEPIPYTGLHLSATPGGYPKIDWIEQESPAHQAELDKFDILIALDGERVLSGDFNDVLRRHAVDEKVEVTLLRDDRMLQRMMLLPKEWTLVEYSLQMEENPGTLERRIRRDWLSVDSRR